MPNCTQFQTRPSLSLRIVDIGASGGLEPRWSDYNVLAVLVEPDPREVENLRKSLPPTFKFITTALSDEKGKKDFYLYAKQQCSSFYPPNEDFIKKFPESERLALTRTISMETDLLDDQLKVIDYSSPDLIKVDVEGYELPILKGGVKALDEAIALDLEVNFAQFRKGAPLFFEVDGFLRARGFQLFDLRKTHWLRSNVSSEPFSKGQLILGDALYFLTPEDVVKKFRNDPDKCFRALLLYVAYGYHDLAVALVNLCSNSIWDAELTKQAKGALETHHSVLPLFVRKILQKFISLAQRYTAAVSWASGDPKLGN